MQAGMQEGLQAIDVGPATYSASNMGSHIKVLFVCPRHLENQMHILPRQGPAHTAARPPRASSTHYFFISHRVMVSACRFIAFTRSCSTTLLPLNTCTRSPGGKRRCTALTSMARSTAARRSSHTHSPKRGLM